MLFNSYSFILVYLPVVLVLFFRIARSSSQLAALWLVVASVFFYGWWNPAFVLVLLASVVFNYGMGYAISRSIGNASTARSLLFIAVMVNLLVLGIFKYANFFIENANELGAGLSAIDIVLPLGISFFTFTQIAFLVDVQRGIAREYNFVHYLLFVTWFPHLIAGPVLHHKQMMPQFSEPKTFRPDAESLAVGATIFTIGLFKKVGLADQFALYANQAFDSAGAGVSLTFFDAWAGTLAYGLQLYFDFSGYSDMAIGLSRLFNIRLPLNFNSPYRAASIIDFWKCWHMTLSKFLRDYLYIPLGGNRNGALIRHRNLMATMLLGGLWHGASWNFVIWGGLHGIYLVINHAWRHIAGTIVAGSKVWVTTSVLLTFIAVFIAWVPFRAVDLQTTLRVWESMIGMNGVSVSNGLLLAYPSLAELGLQSAGFTPVITGSRNLGIWLLAGVLIVWMLPNTQQWMSRHAPASDEIEYHGKMVWRPSRTYALIIGLLFGLTLISMSRISQFLYFQF